MTPFSFDIEVTEDQLKAIMDLHNFNEEEFKQAINECTTMSFVD